MRITHKIHLTTAVVVLVALSSISASPKDDNSIKEGLVAYWSFDKDSKKQVLDSSGDNHGTPTKVGYEKGVIGKAAQFDGESSKIILSDTNGNPPTAITDLEVGTVSFWVKFENRGGQILPILFLGKDNTSMPSRSMMFEIGHDRGDINNRRLYFTTIRPAQSFCVDSGQNLIPGVWYHYVAVMDRTGGTIYINGVEITTRRYNLGAMTTSCCFFNDVTNKEMLAIGYGRYSQEEPFFSFNGLIDDIRVYNRPLDPAEVLQLFDMSGLKMGDPELGYIDAASMVGKVPTERGGANGTRTRQQRTTGTTTNTTRYNRVRNTNQ